ncbi:YgcG family protein [Flagellimonas sp. S3867]|uniref:TPM domain-containing protein n=1 Tax=Flagellimonas sp. S3867 TaxID=2768063 RepID=UPI001681F1B3|nr:TPM domain-containing protein [Flagellimonas sp. S3867]
MKKTLLAVLLIVISSVSFGQQRYLLLEEIVTDSAHIFSTQELEGLKAKLTQFETETTNQLVILTIDALGNETIEEYANGTFNQNQLGQKDKDNGILILFSKNDREVRIEVGYGLEPYITDAVASGIIRNTMIPAFKEDNYFDGLNLATDQLIEFLNNPEALEEFKNELEAEGEMGWGIRIFIILFLLIFVAAGGFIFYRTYSGVIEAFRGMMIGKLGVLQGIFMILFQLIPILFSIVFIVMPLFFAVEIFGLGINLEDYTYLLDDVSWTYYLVAGFLVFTLVLAAVKILIKGKEGFKLSLLKSDSTYMSKTFSSGGSHSFGSSSSGGSSSSFSGGGGSSGGGGASGSW